MSWSARKYVEFEAERTRPVRDLLAVVPDHYSGEAIDLGCGPGNSTELLRARLPAARVSGIDNSAEMIEAARNRLPQLTFSVEDIGQWRPQAPLDVILANAVLQWLPDHAALISALIGRLTPGGALAVQMPDNLDGPAHRRMREIAAAGPWAKKLTGAAAMRTPLEDADWYYNLLRPLTTRVDIWRTTYIHPLAGAAAVVEWFKGSGLRPFLQPLDDKEKTAFLQRFTDAVARDYTAHADGAVLLPFPRLFMVAIR